MNRASQRFGREQKTLEAMLGIYCRDRHGTREGLCDRCRGLREYSLQRLTKCPFGEKKPRCSDCQVHCYAKEMRDSIREVMKYAGPRMMTRHPLLAARHLIRGALNKPAKRKKS